MSLGKLIRPIRRRFQKLFEGEIDGEDREKIAHRTQTNHHNYNYRLNLDIPVKKPFSFLVLGDSGDGDQDRLPKSRVAAEAAEKEEPFEFILHLGDVVYLSGAKEGYKDRFIAPYHRWLNNGPRHEYDNMVFKKPFLPIYGNHDYYDFDDIPIVGDFLALFGDGFGKGSNNGAVFEDAFIKKVTAEDVESGFLNYVPERQTRIPNRYYWFTYGNCAFFALDSNTLDGLPAAPSSEQGTKAIGEQLKRARSQENTLERHLDDYEEPYSPKEKVEVGDLLDDLAEAKKEIGMLKKALKSDPKDHDFAQIQWLKDVLEQNKSELKDKWKIVYLHHPFYRGLLGILDGRILDRS